MALSLEKKIGQMFILGFRGLTVDTHSPIIKNIKADHLGGVILFSVDVAPYVKELSALSTEDRNNPELLRKLKIKHKRNVENPDQVKKLIENLHQAAPPSLPLFLSIDQEGGRVSRLNEDLGFPKTTSMASFGKQNDISHTHRKVSEMADMLSNLKVNFNLAPVVDVNLNPDNPIIARFERSFSRDPGIVARHAIAYINAHHDHNLLTCIKHFPGHGSAGGDTHAGFIDISGDWQEDVELFPYRHIIQKGKADAVMIAHVFHKSWHDEYPATMSETVVTGMLRERLGYDGVVMTDDIQMSALDRWDLRVVLKHAILAGVDMFIIGNNQKYEEGIFEKSVRHIKEMVKRGEIDEAMITTAFNRITRLKMRV